MTHTLAKTTILFVIVLLVSCLPVRSLTQAPIVTPFPLSTPTSNTFLRQDCLLAQDAIPTTESLSGYLLVEKDTSQRDGRSILAINLQNQISLTLFDSNKTVRFNPTIYTISPDNKWFVYFQEDNDNRNSLYLGNIENNNQRALYWDSSWGEIVFWLNNNQLFIPPGPNQQSAIILNPFTGEWDELQSKFPSGLNFSFPYFYYNSTLSSAIYISGDNYILWDKKSNKDIWIKSTFAPYLAPRWSPDGRRAALVVRNENNGLIHDNLVLVNQDGEEIDIDHFLQGFRDYSTVQVKAIEWSPNNQLLALSLELKNDNVASSALIIVDTLTGQSVDLCIPVANNIIIWLPDSEKLIVEAFSQNDQKDTNINLINIKQGWTTKLDENLIPLAWMATP